ncbi:hypothetical protein UPYG_G00139760 [Umbra pygmaea]|uniref:Tumor necrosis factor receptor superfamily member 12A n=1 Tax=Umbra pygmaea TaxID=75934 RepID=A0ABD0WZD7_UMBPY
MAVHILCALCGLIIASVANLYGVNGQKGQCSSLEFWSADIDDCVLCSTCKQYPKTPSCNTCKFPPVESPDDDVWRVAAIFSFSVLAVVLVVAVLIIGVMLHQRNTQRPLREPIEETTGPLYQA